MRRRARPLVRPRDLRAVGLFAFALAFAVRAAWGLRVQRPLDALYADMGGYVLRAELLLAGKTPAEPRMLVLWPWGTHAIVAGEIVLFGRHANTAFALCHALVGAIVAPCAAGLTARFVRSRRAALLAGVATALWHPHVVYTGYVSSEIWFTTALVVVTLFAVRVSERRRVVDALVAGVALAVAFVVRPQVLLTVAIVAAGLVVARLRGRRAPLAPRAAALVLVPFALAIAGSAVRYRRLTGRFGLIAASEPVQRLFGETDVAKIESTWTAPNGDRWAWWYNPPTKKPVVARNTERFEGFIADPVILARIRAKRLAGVTLGGRVARAADNVALLALRNVPWPEEDRKIAWRRALQRGYARALLVVLAYAALGVLVLRRHPFAALLVRAQLATIVLVGALYLGEARYRVPYDPFLIVCAVAGLWVVFGAVRSARRGAQVASTSHGPKTSTSTPSA